jgi:heat shock protein HtpX
VGLWSQPMSAKVAAILIAGLFTLLALIIAEIRSQARAENPRPPKPPSVTPGVIARLAVLLAVIAAPFAILGYWFGAAAVAAAGAIVAAMALRSLRLAEPAILAQCGARNVTDRNLIEAVQELAAKAGIPAPHLLEIQETHPNAFALGAGPVDAAIVVTLGLRTRLTGEELRAVIGHEISHIARRDTLRAIVGVTLMRVIAALALRLRLIGLSVGRQGGRALLFLAILAPVSAVVLRFAASRAREYEADREGARLCGDPDHLIRALAKLDTSTRRFASITANDQPALAALFFVNPLPNSWVGRLFSAHPPIARRIARLRAINRRSTPRGTPPRNTIEE